MSGPARWPLLLTVGVLWLAAGVWPAAAQSGGPTARGARVALVVGNGAYASVGRLPNPSNDAKLIARSLKASGFTLIGGDAQIDMNKAHFDRVVAEFGRAIVGADVALFYYSGHGLQVDGVNFLVPVDANPSRRQDLDFQMVSADLVLRQMSGSGTKLNIIILDACRNNPFEGTGLRSAGGGLAEMKAPEGTLISYATQPGAVARDGVGQNSPFTLALADAIHQPGLDIFRLFNRVGLDVKRETEGAQQPWLSASPIEGDFSFVAAPPVAATPAVPTANPPTAASAEPSAPAAADTGLDRKTPAAHGPVAGVGRPTAPASPPTPPEQVATIAPPFAPSTLLPPSAAPERAPGQFHCPAKDAFVFGEDEVFDWKGSTPIVRQVKASWSWRALGSDPAAPHVCVRAGKDGPVRRLVEWFDTDHDEFANSPEQPVLALLQGQSREASVRYVQRQPAVAGPAATYKTEWRLRGHESFTIGRRAYDTLVIDLTETNTRWPNVSTGRLWFAPELGLFVRKVWRAGNAAEAQGFSIIEVSNTGAGSGTGTAAN